MMHNEVYAIKSEFDRKSELNRNVHNALKRSLL